MNVAELNVKKHQPDASKAHLAAGRSIYYERLTNAEIESLRQDLNDKTAYLQKVYPNLRQAY